MRSADEHAADLVVLGTHGRRGFDRSDRPDDPTSATVKPKKRSPLCRDMTQWSDGEPVRTDGGAHP